MRRALHFFILGSVFSISISISSLPLSAQSMWSDHGLDKAVVVEYLKPNFDGDDNTSFFTSVLFVSVRYPVTERTSLKAEFPFSHYGSEEGSGASWNTIGNPYIGVDTRKEGAPVTAEIGFRLPIAADEEDEGFLAAVTGYMTDYIDRAEAFTGHYLPIITRVNYRREGSSGVVGVIHGGPSIWIRTKENGAADDLELFLLYGFRVGYEPGKLGASAGLSGRWYLSTDMGDFADRINHQIVFGTHYDLGRVRPGLQIRLPLDEDIRETLDFVLGASLSYEFE